MCFYCGAPAGGHDHMLPVIRGGTGKVENLVPACNRCNCQKHSRTVDEYRLLAILTGKIKGQYFAGEKQREPVRDFLAVSSQPRALERFNRMGAT